SPVRPLGAQVLEDLLSQPVAYLLSRKRGPTTLAPGPRLVSLSVAFYGALFQFTPSFCRSRSHRSSRRHYSCSRSHSRQRRSRSRSYSSEYRRCSSQSHSPMSNRRRHVGDRANPDPNSCLGVFGLSLYTTERDLREVFSKFGPLSDVSIVYDQQSRRSRGFAFVYFENREDSKEAKERANGMELDGRRIRVDFSITKRPHTPTPGIYMGRPTYGGGLSVTRRRDCYERGYDRYDDHDYYNSRSYSFLFTGEDPLLPTSAEDHTGQDQALAPTPLVITEVKFDSFRHR
ncbi:hypothetical protein cypCar_00013658, partial [Cyprinus carpio]